MRYVAGDEVIDLTKKEFDLLLFLAKNKNRVLKRRST
ncbi:MAG: helix-turn-helix domain-containing protein [Dialister sp.]